MENHIVLGGRYRLGERLGAGGMSVVHYGHDEVLERDVAIKLLAGSDVAARRRIRAEALSAARLSHPNITNVYDYGESTGPSGEWVPYVVMELLPGISLARRLADGPLPAPAALRVCAEVAGALAAAHERGLVHRDIKAGNVMLTPTGAKVVDFGIAAATGDPEVDFDGQLMGTPAYLAPERLTVGEVTPASDVYALGLLLHRVLTARLPWENETTTQMLRSHAYVDPMPLPPVPGVPDEVHQLCRRCLAKDPVARPSAEEAAAVLSAAALPRAAGGPGAVVDSAPDPAFSEGLGGDAGPERSGGRAAARRPVLLVFGAVVLVVLSLAVMRNLPWPGGQGGDVAGPGALPPGRAPGGATAASTTDGASRAGGTTGSGTPGATGPGGAGGGGGPPPGGPRGGPPAPPPPRPPGGGPRGGGPPGGRPGGGPGAGGAGGAPPHLPVPARVVPARPPAIRRPRRPRPGARAPRAAPPHRPPPPPWPRPVRPPVRARQGACL
ncbi:serine/threonine-protein kinase [Micromonospora sp. NPDC000089]|uniref:serine/threonine-protein kinase n=1 Tax=Micromonospora sp. NPDC000089 TaxID=3364213 RepID=UPI0036B6AED1